MSGERILEVESLSVRFGETAAKAVEDISFSVNKGEKLGIAGESGSGKTASILSILGLLPRAIVVHGNDGGILCAIGELSTAPEDLTGLFVERCHRPLIPSGSAEGEVAVYNYTFGVTPFRGASAKAVHARLPQGAATGVSTDEVALAAHGVNTVILHSRCAARAIAPAIF